MVFLHGSYDPHPQGRRLTPQPDRVAEWEGLAAESPDFQPAWPAAHDPVMRRPAKGLERLWVTAEPAAAWLDLGNALYGLMLQLLTQAFSQSDTAYQTRLMKAGVEVMEAGAAVAMALARMPANADHPGVNAGLTFAAPRSLGYRPGGRGLFAERAAELRAGAARLLTGETAEKVERRMGNALDALNES